VWTPKQRTGAIIILAVVIASLAIVARMNPVYISDKPEDGALAAKLKDRLDPNTASADDLAILPMLGTQRAREIIAFRQREIERHPNTIVFEKVEDLSRVRGIGVATAKGLEQYLVFPITRPATAPAL
jgi:hypothetical protein